MVSMRRQSWSYADRVSLRLRYCIIPRSRLQTKRPGGARDHGQQQTPNDNVLVIIRYGYKSDNVSEQGSAQHPQAPGHVGRLALLRRAYSPANCAEATDYDQDEKEHRQEAAVRALGFDVLL